MAANTAGTTQSLPPVTLVLGGARSGKSNFAERLAVTHGRGCVYLATAEIGDAEMAERVRKHKARREAHWRTVEAPLEIGDSIVAETKARGITTHLPPKVPFGSNQWPTLITPGPGPASLADLP